MIALNLFPLLVAIRTNTFADVFAEQVIARWTKVPCKPLRFFAIQGKLLAHVPRRGKFHSLGQMLMVSIVRQLQHLFRPGGSDVGSGDELHDLQSILLASAELLICECFFFDSRCWR